MSVNKITILPGTAAAAVTVGRRGFTTFTGIFQGAESAVTGGSGPLRMQWWYHCSGLRQLVTDT